MNILILSDTVSAHSLADPLKNLGYHPETVIIDNASIKPCIGCFGCWIKTPGRCVLKQQDGAEKISEAFIRAGTVVIVSRICYGSFSPEIKSFMDRNIPLILPFFTYINNEMHHKKRYPSYPALASIGYGAASPEEETTFANLLERNALNLHAKKHGSLRVDSAAQIPETLSWIESFCKGDTL